jgi:serine protease inhibitor
MDELLTIRNNADVRASHMGDVERLMMDRNIFGLDTKLKEEVKEDERDKELNKILGLKPIISSDLSGDNFIETIDVASGIVKLNEFLITNIFNRFDNYLVNVFGLYSLFGALFLVAQGITKIELQSAFFFPKQEKLKANLDQTTEEINIAIKNLILVNSDVSFEKDKFLEISNYCGLLVIDANEESSVEAKRINNEITELFNGKRLRKPIVSENLVDLHILLMNLGYITPKIKINEIVKGIFGRDKEMEYGIINYKTVPYFENRKTMMIEIPFDNMYFGFVLGTYSEFYKRIPEMKMVPFEKIQIPIFRKEYKYRFTDIIKKIGVSSCFEESGFSSSLFPESGIIHDVLQNTTFDMLWEKSNVCEKVKTEKVFICNNTFFFYIRTNESKTILFSGVLS